MDSKQKALDKLKSPKFDAEPFMIRIQIKQPIDPKKYKLKKDGKEIDMTPPKEERASLKRLLEDFS